MALGAAAAAQPSPQAGEIPRRKVAILVFEGVELLDFAGPGEVFAAAGRAGAFDVFTVGVTREPIVSQGFLRITPEHSLADAPRPDLLVIPGGNVGSLLRSPEAMAWIKATARTAEVVMSVCNGALALAEAGLLEGLSATTHHGSIERLRQMAPATRVVEGERFVDNGRMVTAAGVSAGIDGALHLVSRLLGEEKAQSTARYMEYAWSGAAAPQPKAAAAEGR